MNVRCKSKSFNAFLHLRFLLGSLLNYVNKLGLSAEVNVIISVSGECKRTWLIK